MLAGYYYKKKATKKKSFQKRHVKGTKIFLKKKKTKSVNMLVSDKNWLPHVALQDDNFLNFHFVE